MYCDECQIEMEEKEATVEAPYQYALSGLRDVYLAGITVYYCPKCEAESPLIPRIAELHQEITRALVHKSSLLRGDEIRFLRKHAGLPGQAFSVLLGVDPAHLSRVENGHTANFGKSTDRLVRALVAKAKAGEEARDILLQIAKGLKDGPLKEERSPLFKIEKKHWRAAA